MEIIEHNEAWKRVDNRFSFRCVKGIVRIDGLVFLAEWDDRRNLPTNESQLRILGEIKTHDRGPLVKEGWTVVPPDPRYHIKTPNIYAFHEVADLEGRIAREVQVCELLKLHPHQNISPYFGCTELRGRVSGLCFKKHQQTLLERANPRGLNKAHFLESEERSPLASSYPTLQHATDGLLGAVKHLHSLDLVHNDITPSNIMLDEDGKLVLIDFDSCRRRGESLVGVKRTYGWHDPEIKVAEEENDLSAVAELQTWLFGASAASYRFA